MRAAVLQGLREIAIETVPDPRAGLDGIVIRVGATGICGSEMHRFPLTAATAALRAQADVTR